MKYFMLVHGNCSQLQFDKLGRIWDDYQQGKNPTLPTIDLPDDSYINFVPIPEDYSSTKYITILRGMTQRQIDVFTEIMYSCSPHSLDWANKSLPCIQVTLNGGIEFKSIPSYVV